MESIKFSEKIKKKHLRTSQKAVLKVAENCLDRKQYKDATKLYFKVLSNNEKNIANENEVKNNLSNDKLSNNNYKNQNKLLKKHLENQKIEIEKLNIVQKNSNSFNEELKINNIFDKEEENNKKIINNVYKSSNKSNLVSNNNNEDQKFLSKKQVKLTYDFKKLFHNNYYNKYRNMLNEAASLVLKNDLDEALEFYYVIFNQNIPQSFKRMIQTNIKDIETTITNTFCQLETILQVNSNKNCNENQLKKDIIFYEK